ncbi:hypothetical protein [Modestobacter altitudinis]|uniref:hypothetical protein n=1 Tax=Modestobacter altitudinis TaxID=2213158 RepID=UPI001C551C44|nr:hypothetical protein [Modestobacter altitudinis]
MPRRSGPGSEAEAGERQVEARPICAVALVSAMPSNRTSPGAALDDTAQEVGTSVGTAVVGTLVAALVTGTLPPGTWSERSPLSSRRTTSRVTR